MQPTSNEASRDASALAAVSNLLLQGTHTPPGVEIVASADLSSAHMLEPGDTAPDFAVGETTLYRILEGGPAVVFFFPAAFTPG